MKIRFRRALSLVCTISLLLTCMPFNVLSEEVVVASDIAPDLYDAYPFLVDEEEFAEFEDEEPAASAEETPEELSVPAEETPEELSVPAEETPEELPAPAEEAPVEPAAQQEGPAQQPAPAQKASAETVESETETLKNSDVETAVAEQETTEEPSEEQPAETSEETAAESAENTPAEADITITDEAWADDVIIVPENAEEADLSVSAELEEGKEYVVCVASDAEANLCFLLTSDAALEAAFTTEEHENLREFVIDVTENPNDSEETGTAGIRYTLTGIRFEQGSSGLIRIVAAAPAAFTLQVLTSARWLLENGGQAVEEAEEIVVEKQDEATAENQETGSVAEEAAAPEEEIPAEIPAFEIEEDTLVRYNGTDEDVTVPDGIREIGPQAFLGNETIKTVTLPNSVELINNAAFADCVNLEQVIRSEQSLLVTIGNGAFRNDAKLDITFAENVPNVLSNAFEDAGITEEEAEETEEEPGQESEEDPGLVYEGEDFTVTVRFGEEAGIPEGTELTVREILPETEEYEAYFNLTDEERAAIWNAVAEQGRLFLISFICGEEEIAPQAAIEVQVTFADPEAEEPVEDAAEEETDEEEEFWEEVISEHIDDYTVTVTVTKEAEFPMGTTLQITPLDSEEYRSEAENIFDKKDSELGTFIRAFDITFYFDGMEIEPLAPIDVKITFDNAVQLEGDNELMLIHLHEEEEAKEIESEAQTAGTTEVVVDEETEETVNITNVESLSFQSGQFSTYIVAEEVVVYTFTESGNNYEVVLKYNSWSNVPEDAVFSVEEITKDSELYEQYAAQVAAVINPTGTVQMPALLDISLKTADGEKVQLDNKVQVIVRLTGDESLKKNLNVVHFPGEDPFQGESAVRDAVESGELPEDEPIEAIDIESERLFARVNTTENTVSFITDSFSVFALAYTVDFYYGEFEYHLEGNGEMLLSELFELLSIERNAADVVSAEFSDPTLLLVERIEDDWKLTSLLPFTTTEILTLKFRNGDTIVIRVEDAQYDYVVILNDWNGGYIDNAGNSYQIKAKANGSFTYIMDDQWNGDKLVGFKHKVGTSPSFQVVENENYRFLFWKKIDKDGNITYISDRNRHTLTYQKIQNSDETYDGITLIGFFAPNDQSLIRYEAEENGSVDNGNHYVTDQRNVKHYWAYSGEGLYAHAQADDGYILDGWYLGSDKKTSYDWFTPSDITQNTVFTAKFRQRATYTINYGTNWYWTKLTVNNDIHWDDGQGNGCIHQETVTEGNEAKGALAEVHGSGIGNVFFIAWVDERGKVVSNSSSFKPEGSLLKDGATYTAVFSNTQNYISIECNYQNGSVGGDGGLIDQNDLAFRKSNKADSIVWAAYGNNGVLLGNLWPIANSGYEFAHWEFNGQTISDSGTQNVTVGDQLVSRDHVILASNPGFSGQGTLKAVFKPLIIYDIGQINRVGINAPDAQVWYTASWCPAVTVVGANATGDENIFTESIAYNSTLTLRDLSSQTRVTQTVSGYNLLTHYFTGWKADQDVVKEDNTTITKGTLIPAGTKLKNITNAITFTAVWSSTFPGKTEYNGGSVVDPRYNTSSVGFFIRIVDSVADIGDTSKYTECLYTTGLSITGTGNFAGSSNGSRMDYFGNGAVNKLITDQPMSQEDNFDVIRKIDEELRTYADSAAGVPYRGGTYQNHTQNADSNYNNTYMHFDAFPDDNLIFSLLRQWNESNPRITVSGQLVDQSMLTSDYFEIRWYVLKDQENQWHVDGALIPKYAQLRTTKTFIGPNAALSSAKNNYTISVVKTAPSYGPADEHTLTMGYSGGTISWTYNRSSNVTKSDPDANGITTWTFEDSSNRLLAKVTSDASGNNITWVLYRLQSLATYSVTESNYSADGYAVSTEYRIYNTLQSKIAKDQANSGDPADSASIEHVYTYPSYISEQSYQTVAFTNQYIEPFIMTVMKQDGETKHGLPGMVFDLKIKKDGAVVKTDVVTSDTNGKIAINFQQLGAGNYTFEMDERLHEGYQSLDMDHGTSHITGNVKVESNGLVTISNVNATVTGNNVVPHVDAQNSSIVYIENIPERAKVVVEKVWRDVDGNDVTAEEGNAPVTMQLLRNGTPVSGKAVILGAFETNSSVSPVKTTAWTYEWTDLPAYVDGKKVYYSAREEWIGEAGGVESIHYNLGNDRSDGYADYIVSQTQTETTEGTLTVVTVHVENTPDEGQFVFSKVDLGHKAVAGAVFAIYRDVAFGHGPDDNQQYFIKNVTSNDNGVVTVKKDSNMPEGYYWIKEVSAPSGYTVNPNWYLIQIKTNNSSMHPYNAGNNTADLSTKIDTVIDDPFTAQVQIIKESSEGSTITLQGARFSLHASWSNGVMKRQPMAGYENLVSNAQGQVCKGNDPIFVLEQGIYWLVEEEAPLHYQLMDYPLKIVVTDDRSSEPHVIRATLNDVEQTQAHNSASDPYVIHLPNTPSEQPITLRKRSAVKDGSNTVYLAGAEFQIYTLTEYVKGEGNRTPLTKDQLDASAATYFAADNTTMVSITNNGTDNGRFYQGYLPLGEYVLVETKAPNNYVELSDPIVLKVITGGTEDNDHHQKNLLWQDYDASKWNGTVYTETNWKGKAISGGTYTLYVDNEPETTFNAQKVWKEGDGNTLTVTAGTDYVMFQLYRRQQDENAELEAVGSPVKVDGVADTTTGRSGEKAAWVYTWGNIEKYYWNKKANNNAGAWEEYIYSVQETAIKYSTDTEVTVTDGVADGAHTWVVTAEENIPANGTTTVTNVLNNKSAEFGKQWKNETDPVQWATSGSAKVPIYITLTRTRTMTETELSVREAGDTSTTVTEMLLENQEMVYNTTMSVTTGTAPNARTHTVTWTEGTQSNQYVYKFKISNLEKYAIVDTNTAVEWTYTLTETGTGSIPGMNMSTAYSGGSEKAYANEGEYVINTYTPGVELPATGGNGTLWYNIMGLVLILLAGGLLMVNRRRAARDRG